MISAKTVKGGNIGKCTGICANFISSVMQGPNPHQFFRVKAEKNSQINIISLFQEGSFFAIVRAYLLKILFRMTAPIRMDGLKVPPGNALGVLLGPNNADQYYSST